MNRDKEVYDNSFGAGDNDFSDEVLRDDFASGDKSKNLAEYTSNESLPSEQFSENHQPNNRLSPLASSIPRIPSPNEGSQFANLPLFNDNIFHGNVDSGNGNSSNYMSKRHKIHFNQPNNDSLPFHTSPLVGMPSWNVVPQNLQPQVLRGNYFPTNIDFGNGAVLNNLLEGHNFPLDQPNNNFEPLNRSPMIGVTSLYGAHQNNNPQLLADTPSSNIDPGQWYYGDNRCRGIQESVTDVGTSSATVSPSLIAKDSSRSHINSKVNPISISYPRNDEFIPNSSTAQSVKKEDLPLQELHELPDMVKELDENDGDVEDIFNAMQEYANSVANKYGKKLHEKPETDPKREKGKKIRNIHAEKAVKKRSAKELFLRATVCALLDGSKTLMQETNRLKQVIEAQRKMIEARDKQIELLIEIIKSRSNATGLPEQPPPDDSNGGNSGGDSSGRGPGPGELLSRNTQAGGFNGRTFSNLQPSRDRSPTDDLSAITASRVSAQKLLTSSPDGNCVFNSRDNVQSSSENAYRDFLSEEHSDDDECDDYGESSDEESDDSTETNYGKGDRCSESNDNERKACSTRNDNRRTSYNEKKDNWRDDCTEEVDSALLEGIKLNERETAYRSSHSSQMNNGECDDCTVKKGNARVGCIEINDIGQRESKENINKQHLNSKLPCNHFRAYRSRPVFLFYEVPLTYHCCNFLCHFFVSVYQLQLFAYPSIDS